MGTLDLPFGRPTQIFISSANGVVGRISSDILGVAVHVQVVLLGRSLSAPGEGVCAGVTHLNFGFALRVVRLPVHLLLAGNVYLQRESVSLGRPF